MNISIENKVGGKNMKAKLNSKILISALLSFSMIVMLLSGVRATENETLTSSNWEYVVNGENVYIMKYTGTEEDVVVPVVIDGKKVVSIGEDTFTDCKTLKNITLSENIKNIESNSREAFPCFNGCDNLENIIVDENNSEFSSEDGVLYSKDKKQLFSYPKSKKSETYNMPASVKKVEEFNALINLKYLKNLTLSKNLSVTPSCNDSSIESVTIPGQIGGIDESSFENCNKLNKVTITKGLRFINDYAFFECKALKEIKLPEGLQSIGVGVFYRTGIKQLTIPGSVVKIDVIDKSIKLSKPSYLKKFKRDSGAIYYEARATIKASGKKAVTYKASRITKIKAKTSKVTIQKGKTTKLQTRVYISKKLKKGYLDPEILKFTTSNKKVVKVSSKGTIKGLKKGKATVTVKLRTTGKTYKVNVKVK